MPTDDPAASSRPDTVMAVEAARRSTFRLRLRERLRNSLMVVPTVAIIFAFVVADALTELDHWLIENDPDEIEVLFDATAASVQQVTAAIATAMLTFMGVVFSLTILALQMASSQFSPRVMRTFVRSRMTKYSMGFFIATFTYALVLLSNIEPGDDQVAEFLPAVSFAFLLILVMISLFLFVAYVNNVVRLVRVAYIIETITDETHKSILETSIPPEHLRQVADVPLGEPTSTIMAGGQGGVLGGVDVRRLTHLAHSKDCTLVLRARVGEYIGRGQPMIDVHGGDAPGTDAVNRAVFLDTERTMFEDPAFGIRQLVDIAVRALSPGVNDPTTAVQALDRITDLLMSIGHHGDLPTHYVWSDHTVRLIRPVHTWEATIDLAFTEIRRYGYDSPQIPRRVKAAIITLLEVLDESRHPPLRRQLDLLERDVQRAEVDAAERAFYLEADRGGLG
jgi:uncharacterized membrane protein